MIHDSIIRLIVVEESANDAEMVLNRLRKARLPIRPQHIEDVEDLQTALGRQEWDLIISVPVVGELTVAEVCELVNGSKQDIPVVVITNKLDADIITNMISAGARQVIPAENDICLQIAVKRELENLDERRERRRLESLYRESQQHNMMLLETSRDAIAYVHDGMHIHANPSYLDMFGHKDMEDLEGLPVLDLVGPKHQGNFKDFMREYMTNNKDDADIELMGIRVINGKRKLFPLKMEVSQAIYENERCIQIIIRDQSSSEDVKKLKKELARKDQLTELYNRQYFVKLLTRALDDAAKNQTRSVLLYLAIDNYNNIREQVGIGGSDPILVSIANVLRQEIGEDASIARFGDSVFTLLIKGTDVKAATEVGDTLRKAIEANVVELDNNQQFVVTCSVGVALVLASAGKPQTVLSDAHAACQRAHQQGGNQVEVYKAEIPGGATQDLDTSNLAKVIETAIEEKRLSLAYQAILGLQDEAKEMYDVFLRMVDADGNPVSAGKIFAAAEQANLSIQLDKWVLKEAVRILQHRSQRGHNTHFFIKLSDQAVRDESLLLYISRLLRATNLSGEYLTIEISESTAISQIKYAKAFVTNLQKMRCKSALEHFGTGLNSATTLKHLPVDYVKIDSSYAKGLSSNTDNQESVKNIIEMAHSHDKLAIAEAVEDANSLAVLFSCGADYAQGHYIHEPSENMDYDFSDN